MEYWKECISEALEDAGLSATNAQIETIAEWVEGAHENYGMAHGYDVISSPAESQAEKELRELKEQIRKHDEWVNRTKPCKACTSTGIVLDGWGRDQTCDNCDGKGRS
jgi:DnaJ-class molecular chaperone